MIIEKGIKKFFKPNLLDYVHVCVYILNIIVVCGT